MRDLRRIGELDGLRAIAALLVMVAHYPVRGVEPTTVSAGIDLILRLGGANLAVAFFFVLSSCLLTLIAAREVDTTGSFSRGRFMLRRVFRIWPLYIVVVAVNLLIVAYPNWYIELLAGWPETGTWLREHFWLYAAFLGNWSLALATPDGHLDRSPPGLAVLWSIAVEEQFYVVYALVAGLALGSVRAVRLTLVAAVALGVIWRAFQVLVLHPMPGVYGYYYATPSYLDMFAAGALTGLLLARRSAAQQQYVRIMRSPWTLPAIVCGLGALSAVWINGLAIPPYVIWSYTVAAGLMAALVGWSVVNQGTPVCRVLASPPLRALGILSYGIYVWHPLAAGIATRVIPPAWAASEPLALVGFAAYVSATIGFAALTYVVVESPALRVSRRWRSATAVADPVAGPVHVSTVSAG